MKIGLIGWPNSGKTTVFNALTRGNADVTPYADSRGDINRALIPVEDERVVRLEALYNPRKTVPAVVETADFPGFSAESGERGAFDAPAAARLREIDALAFVLRNFPLDPLAEPDPLEDLARLEEELLLADLLLAENRLGRIAEQLRRGRKTRELDYERKTLESLIAYFSEGRPPREFELAPDAARLVRGFRLFALKPRLAVLNSDEAGFGSGRALLEEIGGRLPVTEFSGRFEMELARLEPEDARLFMEDMGVTESARERLLRLAFRTLGYINFFTVGSDEVRAWTLREGETALGAAGTIHSDLARGFIRAERFSYDDLMTSGSEKAVRENGRFSLEGRDYVVRDGDILNIRFNV
jgi:GTP-binding protein YchF